MMIKKAIDAMEKIDVKETIEIIEVKIVDKIKKTNDTVGKAIDTTTKKTNVNSKLIVSQKIKTKVAVIDKVSV
jgi:hypothetical protein